MRQYRLDVYRDAALGHPHQEWIDADNDHAATDRAADLAAGCRSNVTVEVHHLGEHGSRFVATVGGALR